MRIGIQTWGTEGDLRPFFALGAGLAARGHRVTLAYTNIEGREYSALADACGVTGLEVGGDQLRAHPEALAAAAREMLAMSDPLEQIRCVLDRFFEPLVQPMFAASRQLAASSDLLVGYFLHHPLATAAAEAGVPYAAVVTAPVLPSRTYPPMGLPNLGGVFNSLAWALAARVIDRMLRPRINALRAGTSVPPISDVFRDAFREPLAVLTTVSPTLVPRPPDWPATYHVVGFLDLPAPARAWTAPPEVERLLAGGRPPVFMTFGSMLSLDPSITEASISLMVESARLAGVPALVQVPDALVGKVPRSDTLVGLGRAPHNTLFPRCACVVHHGGAGTTQAAMRAGVPSVIVPFASDQIGWAGTLRGLGVAPRAVLRRRATPQAVARRIRQVLATPAMRSRAAALGARMQAEDGVAVAVRLLESLVPALTPALSPTALDALRA